MITHSYSQDSTFKNSSFEVGRVLIGFLLVATIGVSLLAGLSQYQKDSAAAAAASSTSTAATSPIITQVHMESGASTNESLGFLPSTVIVVMGKNNTITWTNEDYAIHTVTSNTALFDSGNVSPQTSFTFTFSSPGTYHYHCSYHPWMTGTVIVQQ
jgi:manganese oxidase